MAFFLVNVHFLSYKFMTSKHVNLLEKKIKNVFFTIKVMA